jgi:hypothetical protein
MIPKGQLDAGRAWAAYQWGVKGRKQRLIGQDLGFSEAGAASAANTLIVEFLAAIHPERVVREYAGRPTLGIYRPADRQELLRKHFGDRAPPRPDWVKEPPPSVWLPARRRALQRVRDPDERWAARGVWLSYSAGPGFDWMEPVT